MLTTNEKAILKENGIDVLELIGQGASAKVYAISPYKIVNAEGKTITKKNLCIKFIRDACEKEINLEYKRCRTLYEKEPDRFAEIVDLVWFNIPDENNLSLSHRCAAIVMERLEQIDTTRLSVSFIVKLLYEIAYCIAVMHILGMSHNDIKLKNVLFCRRTGTYVLIDYNISANTKNTFTSNYCAGSFNNIAPERLKGENSLRSDFYSLGFVGRELLKGEEITADPRLGTSPEQINFIYKQKVQLKPLSADECPSCPDLIELINKMTTFDRSERHSNYKELVTDFNRLIDKYGINVYKTNVPCENFIFAINNTAGNINDVINTIRRSLAQYPEVDNVSRYFTFSSPLRTRPLKAKYAGKRTKNVELIACDKTAGFLRDLDYQTANLFSHCGDKSIHVCVIDPSNSSLSLFSRFRDKFGKLFGESPLQVACHIVHPNATEHVSNRNISEISILNSTKDLERYFAFFKEDETDD